MTNHSFARAIVWVAIIVLSGCSVRNPHLSQEELRDLQTRTYPVADPKLVTKAVVNALQDEGFIVKNANLELGLVSATKEAGRPDPEGPWLLVFLALLLHDPRYDVFLNTECSANVSESAGGSKVRVNFQRKKVDRRGNILDVRPVLDPETYRDFFSLLERSIFLEK